MQILAKNSKLFKESKMSMFFAEEREQEHKTKVHKTEFYFKSNLTVDVMGKKRIITIDRNFKKQKSQELWNLLNKMENEFKKFPIFHKWVSADVSIELLNEMYNLRRK